MPTLKIGTAKYHLAFRVIVRCQLRTEDSKHAVIAEGEATCLSTDPFDEKQGKRLAFAKMIKNLGMVQYAGDQAKNQRRYLWAQFLFWLSGKKKPQLKMRKAPAAASQPDPLALGKGSQAC